MSELEKFIDRYKTSGVVDDYIATMTPSNMIDLAKAVQKDLAELEDRIHALEINQGRGR